MGAPREEIAAEAAEAQRAFVQAQAGMQFSRALARVFRLSGYPVVFPMLTGPIRVSKTHLEREGIDGSSSERSSLQKRKRSLHSCSAEGVSGVRCSLTMKQSYLMSR